MTSSVLARVTGRGGQWPVLELHGQAWPARTREAEQQTERDAVLGPVWCGFRAGNFSGFVIYQRLLCGRCWGGSVALWLLAAMGLARPCGQWCPLLCVCVCVCVLCTSM